MANQVVPSDYIYCLISSHDFASGRTEWRWKLGELIQSPRDRLSCCPEVCSLVHGMHFTTVRMTRSEARPQSRIPLIRSSKDQTLSFCMFASVCNSPHLRCGISHRCSEVCRPSSCDTQDAVHTFEVPNWSACRTHEVASCSTLVLLVLGIGSLLCASLSRRVEDRQGLSEVRIFAFDRHCLSYFSPWTLYNFQVTGCFSVVGYPKPSFAAAKFTDVGQIQPRYRQSGLSLLGPLAHVSSDSAPDLWRFRGWTSDAFSLEQKD